jgi:transposase
MKEETIRKMTEAENRRKLIISLAKSMSNNALAKHFGVSVQRIQQIKQREKLGYYLHNKKYVKKSKKQRK